MFPAVHLRRQLHRAPAAAGRGAQVQRLHPALQVSQRRARARRDAQGVADRRRQQLAGQRAARARLVRRGGRDEVGHQLCVERAEAAPVCILVCTV